MRVAALLALAIGILASTALVDKPVSAQQTTFCVVSNAGHRSCGWTSMDACRRAASSQNGVCVVGVTTPAPPAAQAPVDGYSAWDHVDVAAAIQKGRARADNAIGPPPAARASLPPPDNTRVERAIAQEKLRPAPTQAEPSFGDVLGAALAQERSVPDSVASKCAPIREQQMVAVERADDRLSAAFGAAYRECVSSLMAP